MIASSHIEVERIVVVHVHVNYHSQVRDGMAVTVTHDFRPAEGPFPVVWCSTCRVAQRDAVFSDRLEVSNLEIFMRKMSRELSCVMSEIVGECRDASASARD